MTSQKGKTSLQAQASALSRGGLGGGGVAGGTRNRIWEGKTIPVTKEEAAALGATGWGRRKLGNAKGAAEGFSLPTLPQSLSTGTV